MSKISFISKEYIASNDFKTITALIMEPDTVDLHGDITSEQEIKKACHNYMKKRELSTGVQHIKLDNNIAVVQSYCAPESLKLGEKEIKKGSWIGVFEVLNSNIKEAIKNGIFNGVSIRGLTEYEEINNSSDNSSDNSAKRRLFNIDVDEISIVDYPANNVKILSINKSRGENMEITFDLIKEALKKDKDLYEKLKNEFVEKEKPKSEDDIIKSLSPDLAEIFKSQQAKVIELEKAQNATIRKEFESKVAYIKKFTKTEDNLTDAFIAISKSHPEHYKSIEKTLNDAIDTIKKSDYLKATGSDNPEDKLTNTPESKVELIAKSLIKKDPSLTLERAIAKVYKENITE
jgi:hypothetical protein